MTTLREACEAILVATEKVLEALNNICPHDDDPECDWKICQEVVALKAARVALSASLAEEDAKRSRPVPRGKPLPYPFDEEPPPASPAASTEELRTLCALLFSSWRSSYVRQRLSDEQRALGQAILDEHSQRAAGRQGEQPKEAK